MKKKLIIYGLGQMFQSYYDEKTKRYLSEKYELVGLIDKNSDLLSNIDLEINVYSFISKDISFDNICITSEKYYDEIKKEMVEEGIPEGVILPKFFWRDIYTELHFPIDRLYGIGIEIGGPSVPFELIYKISEQCDGVNYSVTTVWGDNSKKEYEWEGKAIGKQIIAEATDLSRIPSNKYDFVLSSNNLEHVANPLKALYEFIRVIKNNGIIILLLPDKNITFDHMREYTCFSHILSDYQNEVDEHDMTHFEEILEKHDLSLDKEAGTFEQFKSRGFDNYRNRCLHHHVFSSELLAEISNYMGLNVIYNGIFDNYLCLIAEKQIIGNER